MTDDYEVQAGPEVKVARDLSEILRMIPMLDEQAEHKANATIDGHGLPGGMAMVTMAPVANLEAWANKFDTAERLGQDTSWLEDEDGEWEPVLYTLCFWTEQWRRDREAEYGQRPTIHSEASFIKASLSWAWDNEPAWDDMAKDVRRARVQMENVLYAGNRVERTRVECDRCEHSPRLIKLYGSAEDGTDDCWKCPACKVRMTAEEVGRAHAKMMRREEAAKFVDLDDAIGTLHAQGRPKRTVRKWMAPLTPQDVCEVCDTEWPHQEYAACPSKAGGEECGGLLVTHWKGDREAVVESYCELGSRKRLVWWPDLWRMHLTTASRKTRSVA